MSPSVGRGVRGHGLRAVQHERGLCAQDAAVDPQVDQEAWLRTRKQDPAAVENAQAWLTTVVARVCLNMQGIVGVAHRPEHPVGDRAEMRPVLFEPFGQHHQRSW